MTMIKGTLVSESMRVGTQVSGIAGLTLVVVRRVEVASASADQPRRWTLIEFESPDENAGALADTFAAVLDQPAWFVDFQTDTEQFVVFSGRIFRYARGDASGRAAARAYARGLAVPEAQLDWPE
jgi:hypothetical protein